MENSGESSLRRLRENRKISEQEYLAGEKWRNVYLAYLQSIGAPAPYGSNPDEISDQDCEQVALAYKRGVKILEGRGKRVLHAVNSLSVFEDPEELGDFNYTLAAAKVGFSALSTEF